MLEKLKAISTIIASILIPVVVAWIGHVYTSSIKEREVQGQFVEMAVGILSEEPDASQKQLREWATDIINRYSGVPLDTAARRILLQKPLTMNRVDLSGIQFRPNERRLLDAIRSGDSVTAMNLGRDLLRRSDIVGR